MTAWLIRTHARTRSTTIKADLMDISISLLISTVCPKTREKGRTFYRKYLNFRLRHEGIMAGGKRKTPKLNWIPVKSGMTDRG